MNGMRDRAHLETIIDIESGVEIIFIISSEMNSLSCHSHDNFKFLVHFQISPQMVSKELYNNTIHHNTISYNN